MTSTRKTTVAVRDAFDNAFDNAWARGLSRREAYMEAFVEVFRSTMQPALSEWNRGDIQQEPWGSLALLEVRDEIEAFCIARGWPMATMEPDPEHKDRFRYATAGYTVTGQHFDLDEPWPRPYLRVQYVAPDPKTAESSEPSASVTPTRPAGD